jgi:hypothetical protein
MPLALYLAVLQCVRPAAQLTGAGLGQGFQISNLKFEILQPRTFLQIF